MTTIYHSIGLMSGTSLDGLDIALCQFENHTKNGSSSWNYKIIKAEFVEYDKAWKQKLKEAPLLSALKLKKLETEWTNFLVKSVNKFVLQSKEFDFSLLDCISSHGHTVFHQPALEKGNNNENELAFTLQIGNGAMLAAKTGFKVICDFRQTDIALGGQGAPLVPIGDELLFSEYEYCLNLGGIANISFSKNKGNINSRFAFDICACNIVLNYLSNLLNFEYDDEGKLAKEGKIKQKVLQKLDELDFYKQDYPKSLGREWVEEFVLPLLKIEELQEKNQYNLIIKDLLHTSTYHSAFQIAESIKKIELTLKETSVKRKLLVTGGGAYNNLLISYLKKLLPTLEVEKGNKTLISYKESLIFAFLGVLRLKGETNTLSSVTGATKNSCSGSIYLAELESSTLSEF